jgi:Rieske Fe-S protein
MAQIISSPNPNDDELQSRRRFCQDIARTLAGMAAAEYAAENFGFAEGQRKALATVRISDNKDLAKVGGYLLLQDVGDGDIFVIRLGDAQFCAVSNVCPHRQCRVEVKSATSIQCPCHHSSYGIDGTYISGPSKASLKRYPISIEGDVMTIWEN